MVWASSIREGPGDESKEAFPALHDELAGATRGEGVNHRTHLYHMGG